MIVERISPLLPDWHEQAMAHLQRYELAARFARGRTLDIACGNGYGSFMLAQKAERVTGSDISEEALNFARKYYQRPNLEFCPVAELRGAFDTVVSLETIEHVPDQADFIRSLAKQTQAGATLVISAPNALLDSKGNKIQDNPFHLNEPTYDELHAWLKPYFHVVEEWEQCLLEFPFVNALAEQSARLQIYRWFRILCFLEDKLRRCLGRSLPAARPPTTDRSLMLQTALVPLLPGRTSQARSFVLIAQRTPEPA